MAGGSLRAHRVLHYASCSHDIGRNIVENGMRKAVHPEMLLPCHKTSGLWWKDSRQQSLSKTFTSSAILNFGTTLPRKRDCVLGQPTYVPLISDNKRARHTAVAAIGAIASSRPVPPVITCSFLGQGYSHAAYLL